MRVLTPRRLVQLALAGAFTAGFRYGVGDGAALTLPGTERSGDVPGGDQTRQFLELLRASQQTVTTTMIEIARLRVALEG